MVIRGVFQPQWFCDALCSQGVCIPQAEQKNPLSWSAELRKKLPWKGFLEQIQYCTVSTQRKTQVLPLHRRHTSSHQTAPTSANRIRKNKLYITNPCHIIQITNKRSSVRRRVINTSICNAQIGIKECKWSSVLSVVAPNKYPEITQISQELKISMSFLPQASEI